MAKDIRKKQKELKKLIKKDDIKSIIKFLKDNNEIKDLHFEFFEDEYDVSITRFLRIFDDNGELIINEEDLWKILFSQKFKRFVINHFFDWEKYFSDYYVKYIKFSMKYPVIDEAFEYLPFSGMKDFFDGEKLTRAFYSKILDDREICKKIMKNPVLKKGFTNYEIRFVQRFDKLDENLEEFIQTEDYSPEKLNEYFDGSKMLPNYYKMLVFHHCYEQVPYKNIDKYFKYCSDKELAVLKTIQKQSSLQCICYLYKINISNLDDYFEFDNNMNVKLKKDVVQKILESKRYDILDFLNEEDYVNYGLNEDQILIIKGLQKMDIWTQNVFIDMIQNTNDSISINKDNLNELVKVVEAFSAKLKNSNSKEMHKFESLILHRLIENPDPDTALELMNEVYEKNNLPDVGKAYLVFKLLYPEYKNLDFSEFSKTSPILKQSSSDHEKDIIIFSDLLKISFGSNNRGIRDYLMNIKDGNELFLNGDMSKLSNNDIKTLKIFLKHLIALYNNTSYGKQNPISETGNLINDIEQMRRMFKVTNKYDLPDRIIRSFGYFAGFKSFNDAWEYFDNKRSIADQKNRLRAEKLMLEPFKIEKGDFIKGINGLEFFQTILQNGSVAKEFLILGATSDATPLDTDLVRVTDENLKSLVNDSVATAFGPIFFVLKNNDDITITRDDRGNEYHGDKDNLEAFKTTAKKGHYGIRTGFPSSRIDYIVIRDECIKEIIPSMKHIIVTQGFYIPIIDEKGRLLFSPQEYDKMKQKMAGIKYYTNDDFVFSTNLNVDEEIKEIKNNIDKSINDADKKKKRINDLLTAKFKAAGIEFKDYFDMDISLGNVQLIDTGSTGRGTQTGVTSDFDFIMRIDSNMETEDLKKIIFEAFNIPKDKDIMNNVRLKDVNIGNDLEHVDIDISFVAKADTNFYSTDEALKDRLEQIKHQNPEKYKDVLANIILAKKVLKEGEAYKPNHARENSEGGLGGVGIENWVLQHNGSFYDAAISFLEASKNKPFEKFSQEYKIWDYGYNYYTGQYDEFVSQNMNKNGYEKMKKILEAYLKNTKFISNEVKQNYEIPLDNQIDLQQEEFAPRNR